MLAGIKRLQIARTVLSRDGDGEPTTLLDGASEVWGAMFEMPSWPTELQAAAVDLQASLFRYGPIRATVERMSEPERLRFRRELLAFCERVERFGGRDGDERFPPSA